MATYTYIARDTTGLRKEGLLQAETSNEALENLHQRGLTPTSINPTRTRTGNRQRRHGQRGRIGSAELAALCWQLSTMLEGGIAITTALDIVAEDTVNPQLKLILHRAFANVSEGQSLSAAFRAFPKVFTKLAIAILVGHNLLVEGAVKNVSFSIRKGEVVGFTGLLGDGKEQLVGCLFGDLPKTPTGKIQKFMLRARAKGM